jgi:UDP-glucose 4-epimerase
MILVTGGAGYIGSHTCVALLEAGCDVAVVDNLCNSKRQALERVGRIAGRDPLFFQVDLLDSDRLGRIFSQHAIESVIHFAGLKAVGESSEKPLIYYRNNFCGTLSLIETMALHRVKRLVFSSSATVYGDPGRVPYTEDMPPGAPVNPYGKTKKMIEDMLFDLCAADPSWSVSLLRYFNPVGAHPSGLIGEDPNGIPNNLMPRVIDAALGKTAHLTIFGDDYPTADGTGVRDYLHVMDLAEGHLCALRLIASRTGVFVHNLGTGTGHSVYELVAALERASGQTVPRVVMPRRPGDLAAYWADPARAQRELGWTATRSLDEMCADSWRFASNNPGGYDR